MQNKIQTKHKLQNNFKIIYNKLKIIYNNKTKYSSKKENNLF